MIMIKRVVLALCLIAPPVLAEPLVLNWPIECRINQTCFIQQLWIWMKVLACVIMQAGRWRMMAIRVRIFA